MKQTVVLSQGRVFLREGWYTYAELERLLEAAGQRTKELEKQMQEIDLRSKLDERKES